MIRISVYSRRIPPAGLGGSREEVLRQVGWELYGAAVWDRVRERLGLAEAHKEGFPPRGVSTTATS